MILRFLRFLFPSEQATQASIAWDAYHLAKRDYTEAAGAYEAAKRKGDTRKQHETWPPMMRAKCALIKAEMTLRSSSGEGACSPERHKMVGGSAR